MPVVASLNSHELEYSIPIAKANGWKLFCIAETDHKDAFSRFRRAEAIYEVDISADTYELSKHLLKNPDEVIVTNSLEQMLNMPWTGGIRISHGAALKTQVENVVAETQHGHTFSYVCPYTTADHTYLLAHGFREEQLIDIQSPKYSLAERPVTATTGYVLYCPSWNGGSFSWYAPLLISACRAAGITLYIYQHWLTKHLYPETVSQIRWMTTPYERNDLFSVDLIRNCGVLVSDLSSVILDGLFYEKPVICLEGCTAGIRSSYVAPFVHILSTADSNVVQKTISSVMGRSVWPKPRAQALFHNQDAATALLNHFA